MTNNEKDLSDKSVSMDWTFTVNIRGSYRKFGFSNNSNGPGYLYNGIYYGRPCLFFGWFTIQLPFVLDGKIYTAGKYTIRLCNKKL